MTLAHELTDWRQGMLHDAELKTLELLGRFQQANAGGRIVDVVFGLGGYGTPLLAGDHREFRLGLNGVATVLTWSLLATTAGIAQIGACSLDVLAGPTMASAISICAGNKPSLSGASEIDDQIPVQWTTSLADPITVVAQVVSTDGIIETVTLTLRVSVGGDSPVQPVNDNTSAPVTDNSGALVTWG